METTIQNVNLAGDKLTILTGQAPEPFNQKPITVRGDFNGLVKFLQHREFNPKQARLEYNFERGCAKIITNEGLLSEYSVEAAMKFDPSFQKIITTHNDPFTLSELLRKNKRFFENQQSGAELIGKLKQFRGKIQAELEKNTDRQGGNFKSAIERAVEHDLPQSVVMKMSPIVGGEPVSFLVDIFVDVRDAGSVTIELESIEAIEVIERVKTGLIKDIVELVDDMSIYSIQV
jgi:hypothetical protein